MRLLSANLLNFCQYKSLQVEFAPGLTAIVGRNGSGKSNLMKAIYAAVTGDFGRNDGIKTDNICQFASDSEPARIKAELEHAGAKLSITRGLRPGNTRLVVHADGISDTVITKSLEANEKITSILGVSNRILADHVFVDQWSIFDFIAASDTNRAKAFQRLFQTERIEALWNLIGKRQAQIIIPTVGIDKDATTKRLTENREQHEDICKRIEEKSSQASAYSIKELQSVIDDCKRKQKLEAETQAVRQRLEAAAKEIQKHQEEIDVLATELASVREFQASEKEHYIQARQLFANLFTYEGIERTRKGLTDKIAQIQTELQYSRVPTMPAGFIDLTNNTEEVKRWYANYQRTKNEAYRLSRLVDALNNDEKVCTVCGSILHSDAYDVKKLTAQLAELIDQKQKLECFRDDCRQYQTDKLTYEERKITLADRQAEFEKQLGNLPAVIRPTCESITELEAFIKVYDNADKAESDCFSQLDYIRQVQQQNIATRTQLQQQLAKHKKELASLTATEEDATRADERIAMLLQLNTELEQLRAERYALQRIIANDSELLTKLVKDEEEAAHKRSWFNYCEDMRHILHRDNLPRMLAHNYLEEMQEEINNLLVRFGGNFTTLIGEDLSFIAKFQDGRTVPAARLSGGEKVLLALAFRVAVNDVFAKDLGLLVLDEPTAGLDENNIGCLRIAIERLKELSSARGLQVIMITHERELNNLFDHVITLGG